MNLTRPRSILLAFLFAAALPGALAAQGLEAVKAAYTKYEYRIPMRDGKKLFTAVYVPKDPAQKWPILMMRTPYGIGPYAADRYPATLGPSAPFAKEGSTFAYQALRG